MAEFTGNIGTPSGGFTLKVEYSYTQDIANNRSSLTAKGYVKRNNSTYYPYNSTSSVVLTIDGTAYNFSPSYNLGSDGYKKICEKTVTITHNADGTKSVGISLKMDGKLSNWYPNGTISKTITLTTIPRASEPSLITYPNTTRNVTIGDTITIHMNRKASFTHTVRYAWGNKNKIIATNVTDNCLWNVPMHFCDNIPSATSGVGTIYVDTYSGSTFVGTRNVDFTGIVPNNVVPVINSIDLSEANGVPTNFGYVQNKSKLKVVTNASGIYGSWITNYQITGIDNNTFYSNDFTSGILLQTGTKTVTAVVTDSRGRTATKAVNYTCVPYSNPVISVANVARCNSDGTANEEGTYAKYTFKASVSPIDNKNSHTFKIGYKKTSNSSYTYMTITNNSYVLNKENIVLANITFSIDESYDIQFFVSDYFTSTAVAQVLGTGFTLMDFNANGKAMAIGKVSEAQGDEKLLEIDMPIKYMGIELIEEGSNTNGSYIKFPNGTMICTKKVAFSNLAATNPWGALFITSPIEIGSFPVPFKEIPLMSFYVECPYSFMVENNRVQTSNEGGAVSLARPLQGSGIVGNINVTAIGKWK